jgi:hypothetical protein
LQTGYAIDKQLTLKAKLTREINFATGYCYIFDNDDLSSETMEGGATEPTPIT